MTTTGRGAYNIWHPTIDTGDHTSDPDLIAAAQRVIEQHGAQDVAWMVLGGAA